MYPYGPSKKFFREARVPSVLAAVQLVISGGVYIPPQALLGQEQAPSALPQPVGARPISDQREVSPADRNWMAVR
jgi:hypothetical protein